VEWDARAGQTRGQHDQSDEPFGLTVSLRRRGGESGFLSIPRCRNGTLFLPFSSAGRIRQRHENSDHATPQDILLCLLPAAAAASNLFFAAASKQAGSSFRIQALSMIHQPFATPGAGRTRISSPRPPFPAGTSHWMRGETATFLKTSFVKP